MRPDVERVILVVLDSVGCGGAPDAALFGDEGANTLGHVADAVGGLDLPNLGRLGLGNSTDIRGVTPTKHTLGAYGRLTAVGSGKDTVTGHWELSGVILAQPFPVYPAGFPDSLIREFETAIGRETLGNCPASGTEIINELGQQHVETGRPIVYTSADSVFQVAAHEGVIAIHELYAMCSTARSLLRGENAVGRVIARPFVGKSGQFVRTERRRDYSLEPVGETILDVLKAAGQEVIGIGKIEDIFAFRGLTESNHTGNNMAAVDAILATLGTHGRGLAFANLVDFDALYGHRKDPEGYAGALKAFDNRLPEIIAGMRETDILMITADHGTDPITPGTDHTRERTPILIAGNHVKPGANIGTRSTFADVAATIAELLTVSWGSPGESFAQAFLV